MTFKYLGTVPRDDLIYRDASGRFTVVQLKTDERFGTVEAARAVETFVFHAARLYTRQRVRSERAQRHLRWIPSFVPLRIADEEIGDTLEAIARHEMVGARYWLAIFMTYVWVLLHTVGHAKTLLSGKRGRRKR